MLYLGLNKERHNNNIPNVLPDVLLHVDAYGFAIPIEPWVRHVAIDCDGLVYVFQNEPFMCMEINGTGGWAQGYKGRIRCAGEVDLDGTDWTTTLVRL